MASLLVDSNFLYALYNREERYHQTVVDFIAMNQQPRLIPDVILPEVAFLFARFGGERAVITFLKSLEQAQPQLISLIQADLPRIREIKEKYIGTDLDFVDCAIMALSERLKITQVCTFDRRDFSMFRPKHCEYLELLP